MVLQNPILKGFQQGACSWSVFQGVGWVGLIAPSVSSCPLPALGARESLLGGGVLMALRRRNKIFECLR